MWLANKSAMANKYNLCCLFIYHNIMNKSFWLNLKVLISQMKQKDELEKIDGCRVLVDNLPTNPSTFQRSNFPRTLSISKIWDLRWYVAANFIQNSNDIIHFALNIVLIHRNLATSNVIFGFLRNISFERIYKYNELFYQSVLNSTSG